MNGPMSGVNGLQPDGACVQLTDKAVALLVSIITSVRVSQVSPHWILQKFIPLCMNMELFHVESWLTVEWR